MRDLSKRARGQWGERRAAAHLRSHGFVILDRNWRPSEPGLRGDLDLVALLDDVIVFCEVKARRDGRHGGAAAAVDRAKQQRVRRLAESWLRQHDRSDRGVRFDVIAIDGTIMTHYPAAF
jgi:putative endonuclease